MNLNQYREKVRACWFGKNIGGTLGGPYECTRGVYDVSYYVHDISKGVLPNDDLDLQLVWLYAAERYGTGVNSEILGEHWLSYIVGDWAEYGAGKANMRFGLLPPVSGNYKNPNGNSNGCFIRSEIWACLAPGHPEIAVKYAFEDAITDHTNEGVYAELFCASVESAAFFESDTRKLIDIGLSYIPKNCMVAQCIKEAVRCYDSGETWQTARKKIMQLAPPSFGLIRGYAFREPEPDIQKGEIGFDAPASIGFILIGWLYGEEDFSKSICIAVNCGEDTDCTAGTLGSILAIKNGMDSIDEKWLIPIGDEIKTISIDRTKERFPSTITELTDRVIRLMPTFMNGNFEYDENGCIHINPADNMFDSNERTGYHGERPRSSNYVLSPLTIKKSNALFEAGLAFDNIEISEGEEKQVTIQLKNKFWIAQWIKVKWYLPEGWTVTSGTESNFFLTQYCSETCLSEKTFTIVPQNLICGKYELLLELSSQGRMSKLYIPFVFIN